MKKSNIFSDGQIRDSKSDGLIFVTVTLYFYFTS